MVEAKQKVTNLSRNLRSMKFMRRGENAIDLDAEASELKTRPEQWFRQVEPIETKIEVQQAAISECMDLRWGRASYGGFNKQLERLAEKMNGAGAEDEEIGEDIDAEEVSRRLKLIRSGQFKTEDPDSDGGMDETPSKKSKVDLSGPDEDCDTLQFKRPT